MKKPSMKPTLLGAPTSASAKAETAVDVTVNAPVPGATQTTSGVVLLLRAKKTFSVPVSDPVRTFQRRQT
jgi:hypothetical protein